MEGHKDEMNNLLDKPPFMSNDVTQKNPANRKEPETPSCLRQFVKMEIDDASTLVLWQACLAEFVGTFLLCFYTIALGLSMPGTEAPSIMQIAIATGFFITTLVASLANASGCHVNPAITVAFALLRHISLSRAVLYIIFQCAGGIIGSIVLRAILNPSMVGTLGVIVPAQNISDSQAIALEMFVTGYLVFVVIALLDKGRTDVTYSIPFTIGLVVAVNIFLAGTTSGACMNPARAIGPAVAMGNYTKQWIYWAGPISGGAIGALLYDKTLGTSASVSHLTSCFQSGNTAIEAPTVKEAEKIKMDLEIAPE